MSNELTTTATVKTTSRRKSWRNFTDEERAEYRKAKNERKKALAEFIGKLTPEDRTKILMKVGAVVTIDEHPLSEVNTILCAYQRGWTNGTDGKQMLDLSVVGGIQQWRKAGRRVKKGEHGMSIWFPRQKKAGSNKGEEETALAIPSEIVDANGETKSMTLFSLGTVFDISQTVPLAAAEEMPTAIGYGETIDVEAEVIAM